MTMQKLKFEFPKTIGIMLDLDGTCDYINDEKAKLFIAQLEILRRKFGAQIATISISTHYANSSKMQKALEILSRNLSNYIKIGLNFFYGGIYDYDKKEEIVKEYGFNQNKVKTFDTYYVSNLKMNNQWFAIIDDSISEDTYNQYKNKHLMLVCRPSQTNKNSLAKNNFMSISTTTKGIDGVIELLNIYIKSIRYLSPLQIFEAQKNMISHLSCWELTQKIRNRDYIFLERYFKEGLADENDYKDALNWLILTNNNKTILKDELIYLQKILELMAQHFQKTNQAENSQRVLNLKKDIENKA